MFEAQDVQFMARAVRLAERGRYSTDPNPRVGCVLVKAGQVVGQGWHQRAGGPHAEVHALQQAGSAAAGATAYVTLEPCSHFGRTSPCADALVKAGVGKVIVAMADPNPQVAGQGIARLQQAGIDTATGLLEAEAEALNPGFLRRMRGGLPWIRLKIAASLDGRTGMQSGESKWITGPESRADVQRLRARSSAVISGIGTVLADDPALTVRTAELGDIGEATTPQRQPCRIVLDSRLRTPPEAAVLHAEGDAVILCRADSLSDAARVTALQATGASVVGLQDAASDQGLSWPAVLRWLQDQAFNEVLIEAGAGVAGSALAAGSVDELWVYQAPTLLGSRGRPLAVLPFDRMSEQIRLRVSDQRRVGEDLRTIYRLKGGATGLQA